jgi:hypothetical protein
VAAALAPNHARKSPALFHASHTLSGEDDQVMDYLRKKGIVKAGEHADYTDYKFKVSACVWAAS